ncbi:GNAT family N-acetyltransferase [Saccharibacillus brassicae]|uniref:GNAT family N-acetyltransferase n=1 Tax=Saccharibacillus brassicae TaxID=2583377 RepID=A0A4Y6UTZ4_SACBS|nr:GNAT family N-acetyltransferase [Saccharibacillus brassicae]QDH21129.1 GNAT family N-acetyltransferase [Saccharibacillus brassicae]
MNIKLRTCDERDLQELREISIETFSDTFGEQNKPDNMQAYLEKAFDEQRLLRELKTVNSTFFFLELDGQLAGFLKINTDEAQSEPMGAEALEIERIYVRRTFQQKGLGQTLIDKAFERAAAQRKRSVWLGVWEKNEKAAAFYAKNGFVRTGSHTFMMGDEEQTDWIMTKTLEPQKEPQ